jgi:hypothetical protein
MLTASSPCPIETACRWDFSLPGTRIRKQVTGRTKTEVRGKLRELHQQMESGLRPRRRYTAVDVLEDWLAHRVDGLSARTVTLYRGTIVQALNEELGAVRLTELTAGGVQAAFGAIAPRLSTRTLHRVPYRGSAASWRIGTAGHKPRRRRHRGRVNRR